MKSPLASLITEFISPVVAHSKAVFSINNKKNKMPIKIDVKI
tara:strand:+ start:154 stop:279 length:126 start_codon:yes stop_codon:yes gene_type:complete